MKTMKANLIFGKKQIVLASLVLILGAAVYLNWQFASNNEDLTLANATADGTEEMQTQADTILNGSDELLSDETGLPIDTLKTPEKTDEIGLATQGDETTQPAPTAQIPELLTNENATTTNATGATDDKATASQGEKTKNFGDTLFVSAKTISNEGYFAMASLARTKTRDEVTQTLATILNDEKLTEADKKDVSDKALALTDIIETESRIENLIKAKGFEECVVYITQSKANIVVKTPGLDQNAATQIKNIVVSECAVKGENIAITEIN